MFFTITRLGLALSAPSLILTQSITTYSFTVNGTPTSLVFSIPTTHTVTVTYTEAAYTMTLTPAPMIETHTFTVTAPAAEISSIDGALPQSVQVAAPQGPVVPVVIHGYTASVQIPASASIPGGTYTPSPVRIIAATPAGGSNAAADASQAAANAQSAASEEGAVASNVAGDSNTLATAAVTVASDAAADVSSTRSGIPTHLPIPIVPLVHASAAVQSAEATASEAASNAGVGASSTAHGAVSVATEGFASTASVPQVIITDSTSLISPTPIIASATSGMVTSTTSATDTTSTTSGSAAASSSSSIPASTSSSSTAPAPSTSSTAAPKSGAVGREVAGNLLGAAAGFAGLLLFV